MGKIGTWGFVLTVLLVSVAARGETKVISYVVQTQEERKDTRWTLTEWLRIKERMKMMDVWIAMFSDPAKDKFAPELNLIYQVAQGSFDLNDGAHAADSASDIFKGQFWLTNIISSTLGVRTLNIDFGVEGFSKTVRKSEVSAGDAATLDFSRHKARTRYASANFRIFGKSIQDSSLILKYGQYRSDDYFSFLAGAKSEDWEGVMAGGELSLYILNWLGLEGNYVAFGDDANVAGSDELKGTYLDYAAFIEVSLLRLMFGAYQENWEVERGGTMYKTAEKGTVAGVKLQF